ncbi:hypothetical protein QR680_003117 [Steinernema hermaphroditum]|uniref:Uncharacterized protein n=1 Tax=Steinernema hermaphroditum TaxID=289476 RepID=A0AA39H5F6_9BILA|nr:hypothetical protein QR680_003117 [Steinernema hermaphroditum]
MSATSNPVIEISDSLFKQLFTDVLDELSTPILTKARSSTTVIETRQYGVVYELFAYAYRREFWVNDLFRQAFWDIIKDICLSALLSLLIPIMSPNLRAIQIHYEELHRDRHLLQRTLAKRSENYRNQFRICYTGFKIHQFMLRELAKHLKAQSYTSRTKIYYRGRLSERLSRNLSYLTAIEPRIGFGEKRRDISEEDIRPEDLLQLLHRRVPLKAIGIGVFGKDSRSVLDTYKQLYDVMKGLRRKRNRLYMTGSTQQEELEIEETEQLMSDFSILKGDLLYEFAISWLEKIRQRWTARRPRESARRMKTTEVARLHIFDDTPRRSGRPIKTPNRFGYDDAPLPALPATRSGRKTQQPQRFGLAAPMPPTLPKTESSRKSPTPGRGCTRRAPRNAKRSQQ